MSVQRSGGVVGGRRNRNNKREFIQWILKSGVTKETVPFIASKIGPVINRCSNSGKPIIKNNMVVGSDSTSGRIEQERNGAGMIRGEPNIDVPSGARFPFPKFAAVGNAFVQKVDGCTKYVHVVEFGMRPALLGENIGR